MYIVIFLIISKSRAMLVLDFLFWALLEQIILTLKKKKKVVLAFIWLDYESMTKIRRKK